MELELVAAVAGSAEPDPMQMRRIRRIGIEKIETRIFANLRQACAAWVVLCASDTGVMNCWVWCDGIQGTDSDSESEGLLVQPA